MNSIKALMWYYDISYSTAESYLNDIDEELLETLSLVCFSLKENIQPIFYLLHS